MAGEFISYSRPIVTRSEAPIGLYYVYVLFRQDGRPFYVGKGKGGRLGASIRCTRNPHKSNIIKATVEAIGDVPCVVVRSGLTEKLAFEYEAAFIAAIGRGKDGPLVNLTGGGEGTSGYVQSEKTRGKIAARLAGNRNAVGTAPSAETRAKLSASKMGNKGPSGHKQSEAHKKARAAKSSAWRNSPEGIAVMAAIHCGAKRSEETKQKIREARARQVITDDAREAMRRAWARRKAATAAS